MSMGSNRTIAVRVTRWWRTNRLGKTDMHPRTRFVNLLQTVRYFLIKTWCLPSSITLREVKPSPLRISLIFTRSTWTICQITRVDSKLLKLKTSKFLIKEWRHRKELAQETISNRRLTPIRTSKTLWWRIGKTCSSSPTSWRATPKSRQILPNRSTPMELQITCLWFSQAYRISKCLMLKPISLTKGLALWSPAPVNRPTVPKSSSEVAKRALLEVRWFLKDQVAIRYMSEDRQITPMLEVLIRTSAHRKKWILGTYLLILATTFYTVASELLSLSRWLDPMVRQFTKPILSINMGEEIALSKILMPSLAPRWWAILPLDTTEIMPQTSPQIWSSEEWPELISWIIRYCSPNLIKKLRRLRICTCSLWHSITDRTR